LIVELNNMKNVNLIWKHLDKLPLIVVVIVDTEETIITHIGVEIITAMEDITEIIIETTITITTITDKKTK